MKVSDSFELSEYIHPAILERVGDRALDFLHPNLIITVQALRDKFGAIRINGGGFVDSGLRTPYGDVGAALSAHRFGTAADLKFAESEVIDVFNYINTHPSEFPFISRMENAIITKTWLHIEVGSHRGKEAINIFNP